MKNMNTRRIESGPLSPSEGADGTMAIQPIRYFVVPQYLWDKNKSNRAINREILSQCESFETEAEAQALIEKRYETLNDHRLKSIIVKRGDKFGQDCLSWNRFYNPIEKSEDWFQCTNRWQNYVVLLCDAFEKEIAEIDAKEGRDRPSWMRPGSMSYLKGRILFQVSSHEGKAVATDDPRDNFTAGEAQEIFDGLKHNIEPTPRYPVHKGYNRPSSSAIDALPKFVDLELGGCSMAFWADRFESAK